MKKSNEETRFTEAFYAVLRGDPDKAPSPTAINRQMGRKWERTKMNALNGRSSVLRRTLLEKEGFVQDHRGGRWYRP